MHYVRTWHYIACFSYDADVMYAVLIVIRYSHSGISNYLDQTSHMLTVATRDLFSELDKSVKSVAPMQFWMVCSLFSLSHII